MVLRMTQPIRRVAVLGAGVMGSGIAAHCANAGIPVLMLDLERPTLDKLKKAKPAAFMAQRNAILIETGTFDADLPRDGVELVDQIRRRCLLRAALSRHLSAPWNRR